MTITCEIDATDAARLLRLLRMAAEDERQVAVAIHAQHRPDAAAEHERDRCALLGAHEAILKAARSVGLTLGAEGRS